MVNEVVNGNMVVLEVLWNGTLATAFGALNTGSQMRCRSDVAAAIR